MDDPLLNRLLLMAKEMIRETLDTPTVIDAKTNCRNLTNTLQRVEMIIDHALCGMIISGKDPQQSPAEAPYSGEEPV